MRYLSLFSGIGAPEVALRKLYPNAECIGFSEIEPRAIQIYQKHFSNHKNYGDITTIDETAIPDFQLLVAGFPCQSFSIAGNRGGFEDTRGTMFFHIARILRHKKPPLVLLENVRGLLSHDEGRTFGTILRTLDELGYDAEWKVLDAIHFGAAPRPQVFILALHRESGNGLLQRAEQATPLHACFSEGLRLADDRRKETGRGSGRTLRTFAKLPDWLDSWDSFYEPQEVSGELNVRERDGGDIQVNTKPLETNHQ